jgi:translocation protein SEC62
LGAKQVKRALRALQSDAYAAARKKNPALPEITDRASLENTFKMLPLSMLALRVVKAEDPHEGHSHGGTGKKPKRVKGLWTVRIEPQQEAGDDMYYVWLWEGSQVMRKVYAALALFAIFALVCYPLWPVKLRQGGYYLSWGFLCFLGLFFAMAIFRVILFCVTYFVLPPGFWLFPNLWEDVSVIDSFKPVWAWHEVSLCLALSAVSLC